MSIQPATLKEIIVSPGHVTEEVFDSIIGRANEKRSVEQLLINEGHITEEHLAQSIAHYFGYRYIDLNAVEITKEYLDLIPEAVARAQNVVIFGAEDNEYKLAATAVDNISFINNLERKLGRVVRVYITTPSSLARALQAYGGSLKDTIGQLVDTCRTTPEEGNLVELVNVILEYAHNSQASDIHIEPLKEYISVRFRIDGVMHEIVQYPAELHEKIVFRIKILSRLRTDEHGAAQDGRFEFDRGTVVFDVRVSIIPITDGENIVMRILRGDTNRYTIEDIGFTDEDLQIVRHHATQLKGMILAVGPTGSGKTTVLYTILQVVNKPDINIMTIEDPVEYNIAHVQQTQVNPVKDLTFVTGLRALVRQDPDVIMVGEIRDEETADIAVNAALTGHMLLSTMHTNDAATTFPRLMEMSVEPFLIASSVNLVVAIRLVRQLCNECRVSHKLGKHERTVLKTFPKAIDLLLTVAGKEKLSDIQLYRAPGCAACNETGFSGRIGIYELLTVNDALRALIVNKASADEIETAAHAHGMKSLLEDGLKKVTQGITTLDEVIRVAYR